MAGVLACSCSATELPSAWNLSCRCAQVPRPGRVVGSKGVGGGLMRAVPG